MPAGPRRQLRQRRLLARAVPRGSSVGTAGTFTPYNHAVHQLGTEIDFADFFADETLAPSYVLGTDEPIRGQITVGGWLGNLEAGADATAKVTLTASRVGGGFVNLGSAESTKAIVTPGNRVYPFEITLPSAQDGVEIRNLALKLHFRNVTVLQNGFVDGQGGSWFDLPYHEVIEVDGG